MKRALLWGLAAITAVLLTLVVSFPAAWLAPVVERQTNGRFTLRDAQGTVWAGSAFISGISKSDAVTAATATATAATAAPAVPGRFVWTLSPWLLLGVVDARITNTQLLEHSLTVSGDWRAWHLGEFALSLPASQLTALGAPLNTLKPSGQMRISAHSLTLLPQPEGLQIHGVMRLQLNDIASVLSPVKPLGTYRMEFDWQGFRAQLTLSTLSGPLQLQGKGALENGHLRFSGQAWALSEYEPQLANLLNLLGRRRQVENRTVFVIEFT